MAEQLDRRENDALILGELKNLRAGQNKLFALVEEQGRKWQELHESFALCQQNGGHETDRVNVKLVQIEKSIETNYQDLNVKISELSKQPEKKKKQEIEDLEYQNARWDIRVKVIKAVAFIVVALVMCGAIGAMVLHENGHLTISDSGKLVPHVVPVTKQTNQ